MERSSYKHYRNHSEPGESLYCTSTIPDFVYVFADPFNANIMAASLLDDLRHYRATLHAFVVMGHHIHLLATPQDDKMTISSLMECVKKNSAKRVLPHLSDELRSKLSIQRGLNKRQMWKRSFRGIPIFNAKMFKQKVNYIHMNPVRAGLCERPLDYRWSSRWMYGQGLWQADLGLAITDDVIRHYCDPALLSLSRREN